MPPRVMGKVRSEPRVWDKVEASVEVQLEDQLWLVRDRKTGATEDGTPVTAEVVFGPYAADLATFLANEERLQDRFHAEVTHRAVCAMDEEPTTADRVRVRRKGLPEEHFRLVGHTRARKPAWGGVFLWHLELAKTTEW